jgi:hypothetical protein
MINSQSRVYRYFEESIACPMKLTIAEIGKLKAKGQRGKELREKSCVYLILVCWLLLFVTACTQQAPARRAICIPR